VTLTCYHTTDFCFQFLLNINQIITEEGVDNVRTNCLAMTMTANKYTIHQFHQQNVVTVQLKQATSLLGEQFRLKGLRTLNTAFT